MCKDDRRSPADEAMARFAGGDKAAFEVVYGELERELHAYALRKTGSDAAATDAVHQTFMLMVQHAEGFRAGDALRPWAYALLRGALLDAHRWTARMDPRGTN